MGEWREIETAPKDGTQILVWTGTECICVEFVSFRDGSAYWEIGHTAAGPFFAARTLTHWMPLPEPPK